MELNLDSDLKDLLNVLESAKPKWFRIGVQLGISFDKLNGFRGEEDPLLLMIKEWFNCDSLPTKAALVKVLRSRSVGENRLAREIYRSTLGQHTTPTTEEEVTSTVHAAEESGRSTLEQHPPSRSSGYSSAVENSDTPTSTLSDDNGPTLETQDSFASEASSSYSKGTFPHLKTDMNEHERNAFEGRLSLESYRMQECFGDLVNDTKSTVANHVPMQSFRSFLSEFNFIAQTQSAPAKLFRDCLPELKVAETVDDAFDVIRPFYSFINYELIEKIVGKYSTESDNLREQLEGYETRFDAFCKRKVYECPAGIHGAPDRPKENEVHLVVKMKGDFKGFTVQAENFFHGKLCEILGVEGYALRFIDASEGCIRLVFSLPSFLEEAIFPLSNQQKESLRGEGVLETDHYCFDPMLAHTAPTNTTPQDPIDSEDHVTAAAAGAAAAGGAGAGAEMLQQLQVIPSDAVTVEQSEIEEQENSNVHRVFPQQRAPSEKRTKVQRTVGTSRLDNIMPACCYYVLSLVVFVFWIVVNHHWNWTTHDKDWNSTIPDTDCSSNSSVEVGPVCCCRAHYTWQPLENYVIVLIVLLRFSSIAIGLFILVIILVTCWEALTDHDVNFYWKAAVLLVLNLSVLIFHLWFVCFYRHRKHSNIVVCKRPESLMKYVHEEDVTIYVFSSQPCNEFLENVDISGGGKTVVAFTNHDNDTDTPDTNCELLTQQLHSPQHHDTEVAQRIVLLLAYEDQNCSDRCEDQTISDRSIGEHRLSHRILFRPILSQTSNNISDTSEDGLVTVKIVSYAADTQDTNCELLSRPHRITLFFSDSGSDNSIGEDGHSHQFQSTNTRLRELHLSPLTPQSTQVMLLILERNNISLLNFLTEIENIAARGRMLQ